MALYLVVHHRDDPSQPSSNAWLDADRLQGITTSKEIGRLCAEAKETGHPVFVHRRSFGAHPEAICCSVKVARVDPVDVATAFIGFADWAVLHASPKRQPLPGESWYLL